MPWKILLIATVVSTILLGSENESPVDLLKHEDAQKRMSGVYQLLRVTEEEKQESVFSALLAAYQRETEPKVEKNLKNALEEVTRVRLKKLLSEENIAALLSLVKDTGAPKQKRVQAITLTRAIQDGESGRLQEALYAALKSGENEVGEAAFQRLKDKNLSGDANGPIPLPLPLSDRMLAELDSLTPGAQLRVLNVLALRIKPSDVQRLALPLLTRAFSEDANVKATAQKLWRKLSISSPFLGRETPELNDIFSKALLSPDKKNQMLALALMEGYAPENQGLPKGFKQIHASKDVQLSGAARRFLKLRNIPEYLLGENPEVATPYAPDALQSPKKAVSPTAQMETFKSASSNEQKIEALKKLHESADPADIHVHRFLASVITGEDKKVAAESLSIFGDFIAQAPASEVVPLAKALARIAAEDSPQSVMTSVKAEALLQQIMPDWRTALQAKPAVPGKKAPAKPSVQ